MARSQQVVNMFEDAEVEEIDHDNLQFAGGGTEPETCCTDGSECKAEPVCEDGTCANESSDDSE